MPQKKAGSGKAKTTAQHASSAHAGTGTKKAAGTKAKKGASSAKHAAQGTTAKHAKKKLTKKQQLVRRRVAIVATIAAIVAAGALAVRLFLWEAPVSGSFSGAALPSAESAAASPFDWSNLAAGLDGRLHYVVGGEELSRTGIDVSSHQGTIDWHAVRNDGISFAIIRIGYRGTESGTIELDSCFRQNLLGAQMAGLNIGVYFYSQATTVAEAEEEADFVLQELGSASLMYPVVFDFEPTGNDDARIASLSSEEMCAIAQAFCGRIAASGRTALVYGNIYDLRDMGYEDLWEYGYWLASYTDTPSADIPFAIWQYTATGSVDGISGAVDLDIDLSRPLQEALAAASGTEA